MCSLCIGINSDSVFLDKNEEGGLGINCWWEIKSALRTNVYILKKIRLLPFYKFKGAQCDALFVFTCWKSIGKSKMTSSSCARLDGRVSSKLQRDIKLQAALFNSSGLICLCGGRESRRDKNLIFIFKIIQKADVAANVQTQRRSLDENQRCSTDVKKETDWMCRTGMTKWRHLSWTQNGNRWVGVAKCNSKCENCILVTLK